MNSVTPATLVAAEQLCLCCGEHKLTDAIVGYRLCYKCLRSNCRYGRCRCKGALYAASIAPRPSSLEAAIQEEEGIDPRQRNSENTAFGRPRIVFAWAGMRPWKPGDYGETVALIMYQRQWISGPERLTLWRSSYVSAATRVVHRIVPDNTLAKHFWLRQLRDWRYRGFETVPFHDPRYGSIPLGIEAALMNTPMLSRGPGALNAMPIALWQQYILSELWQQCRREAHERNAKVIAHLIEQARRSEHWRTAFYMRGNASYVELGNAISLLEEQADTMEMLLHHALSVEESTPHYGPFPYERGKRPT